MDDLRSLLTELGMSQQAAADKLGVTRETVSRWITGKSPVPAGALSRLADDPIPVVEIETIEPEPVVPADDALPVLTIVRRAAPHGGPWMQIQSVNDDGTYLCWWQVDDDRKTASYARAELETYTEAMKANRRTLPVFGVPIVSLPLKHVA